MGTTWSAATDGTSGYVRALIGAALEIRAPENGWGEAGAGLPARPCVAVLEDEAGRTILLGTTADARAFVTSRCAPGVAGKRADLGAVTAKVVVVPVASGFEADLVYMAMARERTPGAYQKLRARWGLWVVRLDGADEFPEGAPMRLEDAAGQRAGCLLGPVTEGVGARLIEGVVDAFDLCRYPHILKQAPRGTACAYKEMGRCPAPCDGSEAMESYRSRVRGAVESVGQCAEKRGAGLMAEMKRAALEARFEDAAGLKKVLERVEALDLPGLRGVTTMDRFRHVVAAPAGKRGEARVYGWVGGRLMRVSDVPAGDEGEIAEAVRAAGTGSVEMTDAPEEIEGVGVLVRWMGRSAEKRRVRVVRVGGPDDVGEVAAAVRMVTRRGDEGAAGEVEEIEHGGEAADAS